MSTLRVQPTRLAGVHLLIPHPAHDDRGLFTRTFDTAVFDEHFGEGTAATFTQDSQSRSHRGVVRGLHGRRGRGEAKLVRCAAGAIFDVLVDIRPHSPTFGETQTFVLDDENFHHLYIPPGFLHGFQALTTRADVCYRIDRPHDPTEDIAVTHDDPDLAIAWPQPITTVSDRDRHAPAWQTLLTTLTPADPPTVPGEPTAHR